MYTDNLNLQELSKTTFFNFSSILYDWNNESFVFDDSFHSLYPYGVMDVVNENIPNPDLAIVSTLCRQSLPKLEEDPYELSMRVMI